MISLSYFEAIIAALSLLSIGAGLGVLGIGLCKGAKRDDITDADMSDIGDSEIYDHPRMYPRIWHGGE